MKFIKQVVIFLVFFVLAAAILSFFIPASQRVERSVTIQAPAAAVYKQLSKLENFNSWSVWSRSDSSIKNTIKGKDGTVGAINSWKGDPELSGKGKIEILSLEENKQVVQKISFLEPRAMQANSNFELKESNGETTVTWVFTVSTPRPWNIFNLFYSMDKQMGKDFEASLDNLKASLEKNNPRSVRKYEVSPFNFPATTYALVRQEVQWSEIPSFYSAHVPFLLEEAQKVNANPGKPAGLFFSWDEKNKKTDVASAIPVAEETKFPNQQTIQVLTIDGSKAVSVDYYGAYDKTAQAYKAIDDYLAENNLTKKDPVIEQYITGPAVEKDTSKWLTKIIFLVK